MKILQVTTHLNIGGISKYISALSKTLKAKGMEVAVASSGGDIEKELAKWHIPYYHLNMMTKFEFGPKALSSGFSLAGIVKSEGMDILHAHTRVSQVAAAIASIITGVPYVTTCHGYFKKRSRGILDTWGSNVIAISAAVRRHLEEDLGVDESRISLIYSGVDEAEFLRDYISEEISAVKRSVGLTNGPVIGNIGRLSPVKGQIFLVIAMKEILVKRPDAQCIIIGDGPEAASMKDLARSLKVDGSIRFIASCADTHKYLSMMDVFVFPSVKEGLGMALLEALASGKACVASRIGGIEDIITDGVNGYLVNVADPSGIAAAVIRLLENNLLRESFGEEGRMLIKSKFTLNEMADKVLALYKEVMKR